jgi:hypothetical protein
VLHPTELRCTPLSYSAQTLRNEMMNDNLTRKYPWCLLVRTYKLSLIWVVRQTIRNEKMDVYLWKYPWSEVLDKLYYMLDSTYLRCTLELCCTLLSYTLLYPTELCCMLLRINASFFWATLHPASFTEPFELHCTLWATLHNTKLTCILRAMLYPTELPCTLLSYPVPH